MNKININQLQDQGSKIIRQVESGETFEVVRYSKPVAYLLSTSEYDRLIKKTECKECVQDLRKIAGEIKKNSKSKPQISK